MKFSSYEVSESVARIVRLFVGYDDKSQKLVDLFKSLIKLSDTGFKLDIYYVNVYDLDLSDFVELSCEIFGGVTLTPLLEYSVNALPTILIGRDKVIEGHFPELDEIRDILERCGVYVDDDILQELAYNYLTTIKASPLRFGIERCVKCFFYSHKVKLCLKYMKDPESVIHNCSFRLHR